MSALYFAIGFVLALCNADFDDEEAGLVFLGWFLLWPMGIACNLTALPLWLFEVFRDCKPRA